MSENLIGLLRARATSRRWSSGASTTPTCPPPTPASRSEAFPSADVHVLPASGHWPFADAPETVERLLVEFLARVGAPASEPAD